MALFSQAYGDKDETPDMGAAFAGAQEPQDPDAETETPSPVEVDSEGQSTAPEPDPANAYANPPDEQDQREGEIAPVQAASSAPHDDGQGDSGAEYVQGAPQDSGGGGAQLPAMPQYVDNLPNYQALEHQIASFKPSDYKPSIGRRIGAALSGGAVAFGSRNPAAGMKVAEAVNDAPLNRARAAEQQSESATRQQIADVNAQNQTRQAQYQNQRLAANDAALNQERTQRGEQYAAKAELENANWQPDDPNNLLGSYHAAGLNGKTLTSNGPPTSVKDRPQVKAAQRAADIVSRRAEGTAQGLKGDDLNSYALTGRIPNKPNPREPRQPAVGEVELQASEAAFRREHGRGPQTLDEQNQVIQAAKGMLGRGENDPDALIAKHIADKEAFEEGWQRVDAAHAGRNVPEGSYIPATADLNVIKYGGYVPTPKNFLTGPQYDQKVDRFRTDLNAKPAMIKAGTQIDANGNVVNNRVPSAPAVQPTAQSPAAPQPHPTSHTFSVGAWQRANPKGDPNAAKAAATQQGFRVVP